MSQITLVLHNIRSIHNVGSIFRTAEGFGVARIIISGYTPYPALLNDTRLPHIRDKISSQIHKTALGAEKLVKFEYVENISLWLKSRDEPIVALEQVPDSVPLTDFKAPARLTLLLGEEVSGITQELLNLCSDYVEIPMVGKKESFNVSVATGIALYALCAS